MAMCVIVVALPGCGGDTSTHSAAQPATRLTLDYAGKYPDVLSGHRVKLVGHLRGARVGEVGLEASPYPFEGYRRVASTKPSADGLFKFEVRADRNTRYRAVAGNVRSDEEPVTVVLRGHLSAAAPDPHTIRLFITGTGPRGVQPRKGTKVVFYVRRRGRHEFHRIGTRPPRVYSSHALRAGGDFHAVPMRGDHFFICPVDGGMAVGLGYQTSPVVGCGNKVLVRTKY